MQLPKRLHSAPPARASRSQSFLSEHWFTYYLPRTAGLSLFVFRYFSSPALWEGVLQWCLQVRWNVNNNLDGHWSTGKRNKLAMNLLRHIVQCDHTTVKKLGSANLLVCTLGSILRFNVASWNNIEQISVYTNSKTVILAIRHYS